MATTNLPPTVWATSRQLAELAAFYERARAEPNAIPEGEFIANITKAFWPTNCWSFVEEAFAIIAPACLMRPDLVRVLIAFPIKAMIAGGLEDPDDVIAQGVACATIPTPYVPPTAEGRRWLLEEWPLLADVAKDVFTEKFRELTS